MAPTTPKLDDWHHKKGFEIATKHKEAMRQLHWFGKVPICALQLRYKDSSGKPLGESTIRKVLGYAAPERARPGPKASKTSSPPATPRRQRTRAVKTALQTDQTSSRPLP